MRGNMIKNLQTLADEVRKYLRKYRPRNREFYKTFPLNRDMEKVLYRLDADDPRDPNGSCPFQKKWALASVVVNNNFKRSVEIGVYRGSSLLPTAAAMKMTGGIAYGIDPYDAAVWSQEQQEAAMIKVLGEDWREKRLGLNWEGFHDEVISKITKFNLGECCEIIVGLSSEVHGQINFEIDLLHVDGNHDFDAVGDDVEHYFPKLSRNAFVVFDDIDWEGVRPHYEAAKRKMSVVWEAPGYGILKRCE